MILEGRNNEAVFSTALRRQMDGIEINSGCQQRQVDGPCSWLTNHKLSKLTKFKSLKASPPCRPIGTRLLLLPLALPTAHFTFYLPSKVPRYFVVFGERAFLWPAVPRRDQDQVNCKGFMQWPILSPLLTPVVRFRFPELAWTQGYLIYSCPLLSTLKFSSVLSRKSCATDQEQKLTSG